MTAAGAPRSDLGAAPWLILGALTLARTAMGFQFQEIAALGPPLSALGLSAAEQGALIGLYLAPGIVVAIAGGWLAGRFGVKRTALAALALMALGGVGLSAALAAAPSDALFGAAAAARLAAGVGAVIYNVLATKMAADWFSPGRAATAMGLLIVSWPLGIALSLTAGPTLAAMGGPAALAGAAAAFAALGWIAVAALYRAPASNGTGTGAQPITGGEAARALLAGGVWALYNTAFILSVSFGPSLLTARGAPHAEAAATVGLAGWAILPSLAVGGWLVDRSGRPDAVLVFCMVGAAAALTAVAAGETAVWPFILIGLLCGPPGAVIMTLPARATRPESRAMGMGLYFTVYYVAMAAGPPIAGALRDRFGPETPFWAAVALMIVSLGLYGGSRSLERSP